MAWVRMLNSTNLLDFCVEFDHVLYICDARTNCIKVFTSLHETAAFLDAVRKIYKAFSVHEKHHAKYELCNLQDFIKANRERS